MIKKILTITLITSLIASYDKVNAQQIANVSPDYDLLRHGIEQYDGGHFVQAIHTLERYLHTDYLPTKLGIQARKPHLDYDKAQYFLTLAKIQYGAEGIERLAQEYVINTVNPIYRQRVAYHLAHHFFYKKDYPNAIKYYDIAGVDALNNEEIAVAKFELAYSYFVNEDFVRAKPLFASIKEIEKGKYYNEGNYYYGLLAFQHGEYDQAIRSFDRIYHLPEYEDILPYYMAEIYFYQGDKEKVLDFGHRYLDRDKKLFYHKELNQLIGQVYYDQKRYKLAQPYLDYYYQESDQIRRDQLYQLAHTHYQLKDYAKAIQYFKPLSATDDSLGHHAMYLLADAYIKDNNPTGAKQAYAIAATMDAFPKIKQDASFNHGVLAAQTGDVQVAINSLDQYIKTYPQAANHLQAKELLITLLANTENYSTAYDILSKMNINTPQLRKIYQQISLSNGIQEYRKGNKKKADKLLHTSILHNENNHLRAIAQFWKSYIAYDDKQYNEAATLMNAFVQHTAANPNAISNISPEATLNNAYTHLGYIGMDMAEYDVARRNFTLAGNHIGTEASIAKHATNTTILQADAAFMNKNYNEAEILYDQALTQKIANPDYAIYQKAIIAGINGNADRKINLLRSIKKDYPSGSQYPKANYELANALLEIGQKSEAVSIYNEIANDSKHALQSDAIYKIGVTELSGSNTGRAIQYLKQYIVTYPNGKDYAAALNTLRGAFVQQGNPAGYYDFIKEKNIKEPQGMSNQELAYYEAAEAKYSDEDYADAIAQYTNYINTFPNGNNIQQAYYFRAESKRSTSTDSLGISDYFKVIDINGNNDYGKLAIARIADIYQQYGDYERANDALSLMLKGNPEPVDKSVMMYKLLYNLDKMNQLNKASSIIEEINKNISDYDASQQVNIQLINAKVLMEQNNYPQAEIALFDIKDKGNEEVHAQAKYLYALSLFRQGKLTPAEQATDAAISENQSHSYWLEKSYVLIADVLLAQKDYFNARATLQSVIKNVRNKSIGDEARLLLQRVDDAEKQNGKVSKD